MIEAHHKTGKLITTLWLEGKSMGEIALTINKTMLEVSDFLKRTEAERNKQLVINSLMGDE